MSTQHTYNFTVPVVATIMQTFVLAFPIQIGNSSKMWQNCSCVPKIKLYTCENESLWLNWNLWLKWDLLWKLKLEAFFKQNEAGRPELGRLRQKQRGQPGLCNEYKASDSLTQKTKTKTKEWKERNGWINNCSFQIFIINRRIAALKIPRKFFTERTVTGNMINGSRCCISADRPSPTHWPPYLLPDTCSFIGTTVQLRLSVGTALLLDCRFELGLATAPQYTHL